MSQKENMDLKTFLLSNKKSSHQNDQQNRTHESLRNQLSNSRTKSLNQTIQSLNNTESRKSNKINKSLICSSYKKEQNEQISSPEREKSQLRKKIQNNPRYRRYLSHFLNSVSHHLEKNKLDNALQTYYFEKWRLSTNISTIKSTNQLSKFKHVIQNVTIKNKEINQQFQKWSNKVKNNQNDDESLSSIKNQIKNRHYLQKANHKLQDQRSIKLYNLLAKFLVVKQNHFKDSMIRYFYSWKNMINSLKINNNVSKIHINQNRQKSQLILNVNEIQLHKLKFVKSLRFNQWKDNIPQLENVQRREFTELRKVLFKNIDNNIQSKMLKYYFRKWSNKITLQRLTMNENFSDILRNINFSKVIMVTFNKILQRNFNDFKDKLGLFNQKILLTLSKASQKVLDQSFYRLKSNLPGIKEESFTQTVSYKSAQFTENLSKLSVIFNNFNTNKIILRFAFQELRNLQSIDSKSMLINQLSGKRQSQDEKEFTSAAKSQRRPLEKLDWSNQSNFTKRFQDDEDMDQVSNSFDIISLKFKCAFKNLKKNYYIVTRNAFHHWKRQAHHTSQKTFKNLFDMARSKTIPKEHHTHYSVYHKQNAFCKPPRTGSFQDQVNILINHAYILGNFEFEVQVLRGNLKDLLKFFKFFKTCQKLQIFSIYDSFGVWKTQFAKDSGRDASQVKGKVQNRNQSISEKTNEINVAALMNMSSANVMERNPNLKIFLDYVEYLEKLVQDKQDDNSIEEKENVDIK